MGVTPAMLQSVTSAENFDDNLDGNFEGRSYEGMHERMMASLSQPDASALQRVSTSATRPARRISTAEAHLAPPPHSLGLNILFWIF